MTGGLLEPYDGIELVLGFLCTLLLSAVVELSSVVDERGLSPVLRVQPNPFMESIVASLLLLSVAVKDFAAE